jgi:hypothetical protein
MENRRGEPVFEIAGIARNRSGIAGIGRPKGMENRRGEPVFEIAGIARNRSGIAGIGRPEKARRTITNKAIPCDHGGPML